MPTCKIGILRMISLGTQLSAAELASASAA